ARGDAAGVGDAVRRVDDRRAHLRGDRGRAGAGGFFGDGDSGAASDARRSDARVAGGLREARMMIRVRKVTRTFPGSGRVLDAVDLEVAAGDFVTIMGPSGAGKSTLLAVLAMLDHEWQGELWFNEEPVHKMNHKERIAIGRKHVGIVFQRFHLL